MDIFFNVNNSYVRQLCVIMVSMLENNPDVNIRFHVLARDFSEESKHAVEKLHIRYKNFSVDYATPDLAMFSDLKLNIEYISVETFFRYVIADLYPNIDKGLYLDADMIVKGNLSELWNIDISDYYAAGVSDAFIENSGYKSQIGFANEEPYINAGMILMNLAAIRRDNMVEKLFQVTKEKRETIKYQDQDGINITFRGRILLVDEKWNLCKIAYTNRAKLRNATIVHYTGSAKPWLKRKKMTDWLYKPQRQIWWKYNQLYEKIRTHRVRVGLIIDEFFGGAGTAFGGYGFLARRIIAKYTNNNDVKIDVLLGKGRKHFVAQKQNVDDVNLFRLPRRFLFAQWWLQRKNYDVYLSIELVDDYVLKHVINKNKKLILWIQDPRPIYEWDEIETVKLFPEVNYYNQKVYDLVHHWFLAERVRFVSQAYFLNQKAIDLYRLPLDTDIQYLPNPVDIDYSITPDIPKKNQVIFLGRIESVKRGWLFCEIAKMMPEYEFYVLGQTFREKDKNSAVLANYMDIPNLHFAGHVDGAKKEQFLRESKILVNTSIHEALPVSFLEALSYGVTLVSNRNPEELTSKFGIWTGDVLGDGFDKVSLFADAIKKLMTDDTMRREKAAAGIEYVREVHNVPRYIRDMRAVIYEETVYKF